jgi:hypothetical protein
VCEGEARIKKSLRLDSLARQHKFIGHLTAERHAQRDAGHGEKRGTMKERRQIARKGAIRQRSGGHQIDWTLQAMIDDPQDGGDLVNERDRTEPLVARA